MKGPAYTLQPASRSGRVFCRRRTGVRGAAFIEALIVISFMVMALAGLMYFKDFYRKQLLAMRLARASAIAYSLGACQEGVNRPTDWIGNDIGSLTSGVPEKSEEAAEDDSGEAAFAQNNEDSGQFTEQVPGVASEGTGILNEMTVTTFSGEAKVTEAPSGLFETESKDVFKGDVQSRSHVSCSDKVREGGIETMMQSIIDMVKAL